MSGSGWLYVLAVLSPFAVLPGIAVAWRAELAVRAWRQARRLARDLGL